MTNKHTRVITTVVGRIAVLAALIGGFFAQPQGGLSNIAIVAVFGLVALANIVAIIAQHRGVIRSPTGIYVDLAYYLVVFIWMFSLVYWAYGTAKNFSVPLTRLDALYFTIGTLSSAGTGNLAPASQLARGIQTLQMILDLGFILVAVTLVVARLADVKAKPDN